MAASGLRAEKANKPSRKTLQNGLRDMAVCPKAFEIKGFPALKVKALFLSKIECFYGGAEGSRTPAKPDAAHLASQLDPLGFASLKKRCAFCGQGFDNYAA